MNYFLLECYGGRQKRARITNYPKLEPPLDGWMKGRPWEVQVPEPLIFEIDQEDEGEMLPIFKTGFLLMRDDVVEAMTEVGVNTLDCYQAIIRETRSGKEYENYKCVNVIDVARAADMEQSKVSSMGIRKRGLISTRFRRLVLDEAKIGNKTLFRLAESVSAIVVHKKVKDYFQSKNNDGFEHIQFFEPAKWPGM